MKGMSNFFSFLENTRESKEDKQVHLARVETENRYWKIYHQQSRGNMENNIILALPIKEHNCLTLDAI